MRRDQRRDAARVHVVDGQRDVLDDERHPDRGDQHGQPRGVPKPPVGGELDRGVDGRAEGGRDHERREETADQAERAARAGQTEDGAPDQSRREESAQGEDVAMGEVDQLQDPVDERVAQRHEAVHRAERKADQHHVEEVVRRLDRVLDQPCEQERDQDEAQHGHQVGKLAAPKSRQRRRLLGAGFDCYAE